jgi:hypothetical protein
MARFSRSWIVFATLVVAATLLFREGTGVAYAQPSCSNSPSTFNTDNNSERTFAQTLPPCPTGAGSSAGSITDLANAHFNQMITNQVLGSVLLGVNEQVNCSDCVSAFGSAGSFSAGIHGRKELTSNLSLLAGLAYTQYSENG